MSDSKCSTFFIYNLHLLVECRKFQKNKKLKIKTVITPKLMIYDPGFIESKIIEQIVK